MEKQKNILIRILRVKVPWHWNPIAISILALLFLLLGFLGRFSFIFELFVNFLPQYAIVTLISAISLSFKKKFLKFAIFAYSVFLINLILILPVYFSPSVNLTFPSSNIRVMHINVFTANGQYEKVEKAILENDPDIVLLEEVNDKWLKNFTSIRQKYPYFIQHPREDNFGIAMFSKTKPKNKEIRISKTGRVPYAYSEFDSFIFFGIHTLPPVGNEYFEVRNAQLAEITEEINMHKGKNLILLGDLNVTPWSYFFQKLEDETGLANSQLGFGIQPSWPDKLFFLWIPIDHCLVSPKIKVKNRKIGSWIGSDHYPLIVDLEIPNET